MIQQPDDLARNQAIRAERSLTILFRQLLDDLRARPEADLRALVAGERWDLLLRQLQHDIESDLARTIARRLETLYFAAADQATAQISARTGQALTFDRLHVQATAELFNERNRLFTQLGNTTLAGIREILAGFTQAADAGDRTAELALLAGLTPRAVNAVRNYTRALADAERGPLRNVLRDRRFDPSVVRAAASGTPLEPDRIDRMAQLYADRYVRFRASSIAGTEAIRMANLGHRAAWQQATLRGVTAPGRPPRRYWQTAGDERVCLWCAAIPLLNPGGVLLSEPYIAPDGTTTGPEDSHTLCRCSEVYRSA
jgi:hypothetical protein